MKKEKNTAPTNLEEDAPEVRLRHIRFDGFDVYSVEMNGNKTIFHKEAMRNPLIIDKTFKVLGANGELWLCENINTKMIHIGPVEAIENAAAEEAISSASSQPEMEQSA